MLQQCLLVITPMLRQSRARRTMKNFACWTVLVLGQQLILITPGSESTLLDLGLFSLWKYKEV